MSLQHNQAILTAWVKSIKIGTNCDRDTVTMVDKATAQRQAGTAVPDCIAEAFLTYCIIYTVRNQLLALLGAKHISEYLATACYESKKKTVNITKCPSLWTLLAQAALEVWCYRLVDDNYSTRCKVGLIEGQNGGFGLAMEPDTLVLSGKEKWWGIVVMNDIT